VFEALSPYPLHVDELIRQVNLDPGRIAGILLTLELQGLAKQDPGKLFRLTEKAVGQSSDTNADR
jgi:DNA processing protein